MRVRLAVLALALGGALSLPSAAGATSGAEVRSELGRASASLEAAIEAGDAADVSGLAGQIAANAAHTDQARSLVRGISSWKQRARWLGRVGQQYEDNLTEYIFEIPFVDPVMQGTLANAFAVNLQARKQAVGALVRMLPRIPEAAQSRALDTVAGLEAAGDIELMIETVVDPDVSNLIKGVIRAQAAAAVAHMQATIDRLDGLVDRLSPELRAYVQEALDEISGELGGIQDMIDELLDAILDNIDSEDLFDFGPLCDLLHGLPIGIQARVCD
jgi:hypothetical protein